MTRRSVLDWLNDIIAWGERLEGHLAGVSYEEFLRDTKTQDAAAKCAEAIGVAANEIAKIDSSLEDRFPDLELGLAYKARNKLSHGYYMVEQQIVWTTVTVSIPQTVAAARRARDHYTNT